MTKRVYRKVVCEDCGHTASAPTQNTKRCSTCRLGRAVSWHDGRESDCACGRKYVAWHGKSDRMCGRCFITAAPQGGREAVQGVCAGCGERAWLHTDQIAICAPCLNDPANKAWVKKSVANKYRRLCENHRNS